MVASGPLRGLALYATAALYLVTAATTGMPAEGRIRMRRFTWGKRSLTS